MNRAERRREQKANKPNTKTDVIISTAEGREFPSEKTANIKSLFSVPKLFDLKTRAEKLAKEHTESGFTDQESLGRWIHGALLDADEAARKDEAHICEKRFRSWLASKGIEHNE